MRSSPRPPALRAALALLALLALPALLAACGGGEAEPAPAPASASAQARTESARLVGVIEVEAGALTASRSASATIAAAREARVAAGTGGRVESVLAQPGGSVAAGDPVVLLEDDQLVGRVRDAELALESARINLERAERASDENVGQLEASLRAAETAFASAEERLEEARALLEAGGVAAADVRSAEAQYEQARSTLLQARDALDRAGRAGGEDLALLRVQVGQASNALQLAREALTEARVVAPFDGEVAEVFVEEGEFVGAGSPVFRLIGAGPRVAEFSVPPEDAAVLEARGEVVVRHGGLDYFARVASSSRAEGQRSVRIRAEIYPSENPIPVGAVAPVPYEVPLAEGVLVPSGALATDRGESSVLTVDGGTAVRRAVQVLAESGGTAAVTGIAPGTPVISPRPLDVRDGTPVRIVGG